MPITAKIPPTDTPLLEPPWLAMNKPNMGEAFNAARHRIYARLTDSRQAVRLATACAERATELMSLGAYHWFLQSAAVAGIGGERPEVWLSKRLEALDGEVEAMRSAIARIDGQNRMRALARTGDRWAASEVLNACERRASMLMSRIHNAPVDRARDAANMRAAGFTPAEIAEMGVSPKASQVEAWQKEYQMLTDLVARLRGPLSNPLTTPAQLREIAAELIKAFPSPTKFIDRSGPRT